MLVPGAVPDTGSQRASFGSDLTVSFRGEIRQTGVNREVELPDGSKKVVIREIPYGTTTESLIASIEAATQKGKVKIGGIQDYTTDHVEIQIDLPRGVSAEVMILRTRVCSGGSENTSEVV